jgi:hypothetical protein
MANTTRNTSWTEHLLALMTKGDDLFDASDAEAERRVPEGSIAKKTSSR